MSYHIDYEVFSEIDLKTRGAYRYASDPSTEILCLAISKDGAEPKLWINPKYLGGIFDKLPPRVANDMLMEHHDAEALMQQMVEDDEEIWAHNAPFEGAVTRYRWIEDTKLLMPRNLFRRLRCTAALCRRCGLPYGLEAIAELLGLPQKKSKEGKALMAMFSWPMDGIGERMTPSMRPQEFLAFGEYCRQDVRTEMALHDKLKPFALTGPLLRSFLFDLQLNDSGFPVNVPALRNANRIIEEVMADVGVRFRELTGLKPTQRQAVKDLLASKGLHLPDMTADTIEEAVNNPKQKIKPEARTLLELYSIIQYAAVKKVQSLLDVVCPDGWVRGCLLWYGAGTGRWSGKHVQPHNFKKPTVKGTDLAYRMICNGATREHLDMLWGNALDVMSSCIRNFIHGPEDIFDADYNAIEARIVCWLAGQEDVLQMYRTGTDLYKWMAAAVYDRPIESILNPSDERELGKRVILGCGFQMAWEKFQKTCREQYGIIVSDELAQRGVDMYRTLCYKVAELWNLVSRAAKSAIARPGHMFAAGDKIRFVVKTVNGIPFLFMKLPSGRSILYPWPKIEQQRTKYGLRDSITFYGEIENNRWGRVSTYGGKLVENATQGVAADVMGHGGANAVDRGFPVTLIVHDQSLARKLPGLRLEDYVAALTDLPLWAAGLPIKAEGKIAPYYKK